MKTTPPTARRSRKLPQTRGGLIALIGITLAVVLMLWGIMLRLSGSHTLAQNTEQHAIPVVTVITVGTDTRTPREVNLPGTLRAWYEAPVYARVSGYLKSWHHDIGDTVSATEVLAEIDTPDTDAQQRQAQADLQVAIANNVLAQSTAKRWQALRQSGAVSEQQVDEKVGDANAKQAAVLSARANLGRLNDLVGFKKLTAPFDGIVTARNTDIGALIEVGGSAPQPLFQVAAVDKLRVYVNVPETEANLITPQVVAEARITAQPGKTFPLHYLNSAGAYDPTNRTMLTQFELDNADHQLTPGSYVQVTLHNPALGTSAQRLPVNAFLFQSQGLQVATVDADNHVHLHQVQPGQDFGKELEVLSGISVGDRVILNPPDSLYEGQQVRIAAPAPQKIASEAQKNSGKPGEKRAGESHQ